MQLVTQREESIARTQRARLCILCAECWPDEVASKEDVNVAHCLKSAGPVLPHHAKDEQGRDLFHSGGVNAQEGDISPNTVSFHHMRPEDMYRANADLYVCRAADSDSRLSTGNGTVTSTLMSTPAPRPLPTARPRGLDVIENNVSVVVEWMARHAKMDGASLRALLPSCSVST